MRVLVVDDCPIDSEAIRRALSGWEVYTVKDVKSFNSVLKDGEVFDVILFDLNMPDSFRDSSWKIAQSLASCPVLVVSGEDRSDLDYFKKTVGLKGLKEWILERI